MLTVQLKNLLSKKFWKIICLEKCFLYMFCFRTFPLQWCPFDLSTKNTQIHVKWDMGHGNPATLGRKNRTCHVTAPPVLTWCTQFFVTVSCVLGGWRGPLTWQPLSQNLNVSFNLSKKRKCIPIYNCQLGRKHKQYWNFVSIETVSRALQQLRWGEGRRGMLSHGQVSYDLSYQVQCDLRQWHDVEKKGPWRLVLIQVNHPFPSLALGLWNVMAISSLQ
jgi:hypothetical protein